MTSKKFILKFRQINIESENDETDEKSNKYYDIPIKNNYNHRSGYNNIKQNQLKETISQNLLKETMTLNNNNHFNNNLSSRQALESSFTPPFARLHPLKLKFSQKEDVTKEETESIFNQNRKTRLLTNKDEQLLDLIYDHVLGCYYDPRTEIYYELKEK